MYKLVTPAAEIVSVSAAKLHCNVEHAEDDAIFTRLIAAATRFIEKRTARQFGQATWNLFLDGFPSDSCCVPNRIVRVIEIRKCPVIAVTEFKYTDPDGAEQTLASYQLDAISEPARLAPAVGESWPLTIQKLNSVEITFTAGYATVPDEAVQVVLLLVGHWYEQRSGVAIGTSKPLEFAVEALKDSLRWTL